MKKRTGFNPYVLIPCFCLAVLFWLSFSLCEDGISDLPVYNRYTRNEQKRYLAIGFDEFRDSDFDLVLPLFNRYGAHATFNVILKGPGITEGKLGNIEKVISSGSELGNHTWFHICYIYNDPLCNGQDPEHPEGSQVPFPSNEQLRDDAGNGRNAFDYDINRKVTKSNRWEYKRYSSNGVDLGAFDTEWKNLTDEQCQQMRDAFSIYKNTSGILETFDELSNKYCGTSGRSRESWDDEKQCYTGGIFSGCRTSCNHEIWERIMVITGEMYHEAYSAGFSFRTWSWPGSPWSTFVFWDGGKRYYDPEHTKPNSFLSPLESSLYKDGEGKPKNRSWVSVLREYGYQMTHDTIYPSRNDGIQRVMMSKQLILNAGLSRRDALAYPTNRCIDSTRIDDEYPEDFFDGSGKSVPAQMYDAGGSFCKFIESIRHNTANGMVQGELIDSEDTYSEKVFLTQVLEYCRTAGIQVISKQEAFYICFNYLFTKGNLVYNPELRNTAKEFMPDAETVPGNPDGYQGDCSAAEDEKGGCVLRVSGTAYYLHYGIPTGTIRYAADAKGRGSVSVYAIRNADGIDLLYSGLTLLERYDVSSDDFSPCRMEFTVPDNPETEYDYVCEGLGEKIMGLKIVYSGNLEIRDIDIEKAQ